MKALVVKPHPVIWLGSLYVAFFLVPCPGLALTVQEVPNPRQVSGGWVTDKAEILQPETETQLNQMIARLEAKNGAEIAVVTVPETAPAASPKEFTTNLFNYWKIGKKGQDNGVLFLISVKDRRVEIETGYGVEGILPDGKVGNIIETQITPRFRQKDFDGGTLAATRAIIVSLEPSLSKELTQDTPQNNSRGVHFWMWLGVAIGGGLVIFYLIYRISLYLISSSSSFSGGDSGGSSFSGGDSGGSSFSGGDSGGSSFSGGDSGGGSFGGGDSGGGGAGGSW
ncbi:MULTISPECIES: TPM domain-containing protein [Microcystis]|uniref:TPM domain-containing protein n=1 Tax=Microcystis wesenbergii NRERC-220 TaxID=3068991 RepID=A0ABU3HMP2_9CHRO|nr:TPM domain-containing protein [Microcystis wesenbergii]MDT3675838.1 TPM domain-containing protein [Microcystis wesenbergii NRERC-220]